MGKGRGNMEVSRKSNQELMTTDLFSLDDNGLRVHIQQVQAERDRLKNSVVPSVNECNEMIALAHAVLSSRSTDRATRRALQLSIIAILVSGLVAVIPILVG
jgi:hypothetical protein